MAIIDKRFLYYTTEAGFLKDKKEGKIDSKSVVFLSENGKHTIYTHGKFFNPEVFVVGTQSSSTNAFTGVFNEIDSLYDGLNIRYWLPYDGNTSAATLNLTIGDTITGAIPVYIKGTTRFTNHIGGTNVLDLTYRENVGGIERGWWVLGSYGNAADSNTTYTFTSGEAGTFKVKPSNGSEQEISIGKPETAGTADKVKKKFTVQVNSGLEEDVSLYEYDGSSAKTLNIVQGSNINFGVEDGELTINGDYKNATSTSSGLMSSDDKKKLNEIEEGANNYEHPSHTEHASGLYKITVDAEGHVESATKVVKSDITSLGIPAQDTNTHYESKNVVGSSTTSTADTTSVLNNGSVYLNSVENGSVTSSHKISGSGATTVKSDTSGNITITSSNDNTTYTLSGALDGDTFKSTLTPSSGTTTTSVVPVFSGATSSTSGKAGLVPSPESSEYNLYLKADGTWSKPTDTTYSAATTTAAGLMSAADKTKLDGIATGANKYVHPTYTSKSSGLYKITVNGTGHVSAATSVVQSDITGLGIATDDVMTGASSSVDGAKGLVPAPITGDQNKFLRGDGTWVVPTDTKYSHPTYTAIDGKPDANASPGFGGTFTVTDITTNTLGHVTAGTSRTITIPSTAATTSAAGLMSASDKSKLDGIATGANKYVHPSYTSKSSGLYKITVDGTGHVSATTAVAKADITALGIPSQDTTYSVFTGATSSAAGTSGLVPQPAAGNQSKYLRGDGSWVTPTNTTYTFASGTNGFTVTPSGGSAQTVTVTPSITNNVTYSGTLTDSQVAIFDSTAGKIKASGHTIAKSVPSNAVFTDTKYSAGTGISLSGTTFSNSGVRSIETGATNGTIKVNTGGTEAEVSVAGLGTAAYKSSTTSVTSGSGSLITSGAVYTALNNLLATNDAMVFKGTLGTNTDGGTVTSLPSTHNAGWTYKVVTAGTYAGKVCEIGDLIICIKDATAAADGDWTVVQTNIDGAVTGPTSSVENRVAIFDGTSGKVIKDSGYTIAKSVPSDAKFTDTVYSLPLSASGTRGGIKIGYTNTGANVAVQLSSEKAYVALTKTAVTTALGYTPPTTNTTYSVFTGATADANGSTGLVPQPTSGNQSKYLRADGTWSTPTNTTYNVATTSANGLMSSAMVTKLNGIAEGANKYVLPEATNSDLGGIKIAKDNAYTVTTATSNISANVTTVGKYYGVELDSTGKAFVYVPWTDTNTKYTAMTASEATTGTATTARSITAKVLHDKITEMLPDVMGGATSSASGTIGLVPASAAGDQNKFLRADGTWVVPTNTTYSVATTSANGLMSSAMVTKLNGIADNADNVTFTQTLTSGTKIGSISINGTSTDIYCQTNTNTTYTAGTGLNLSSTKFSTSTGLYNESSATTAATAGWYRIATSSASIANCSATFRICGAGNGKHTVATIVAGTSYGIANSSSITVLHCSQYSTNALTKVRIVYHTSYSNNYAYLEIYNPNATALPISVKIIGGYGWSLVTPSTAGSIPSGYSSKEASLTDGTVYSEKFTGNGSGLTSLNASNISSGTIGSARLPDATTSAKGAMTTAMVTKLNGIATGATKVVESTVSGWGFTKNTGTVTSVTLTQGTGITVSSSGTAITTTGSRTITLNTAATDTIGGIKIGKDNSGYSVTASTSSINADVTSGNYYAVEVDKNDKAFVYVPWTDNNTKNTAGSTNSSSKLFLIGATEQSANPQTYSHDTAYVGTNGHLYSNSKQVVNLSDTQALTNKTYNGYTLAAACAKSVTTSVTSGSGSLVTSGAVYTAIANSFAANDAMIFKGTLGTDGTVTALPATHNIGWTYRVITAGTYAGKVCEVGDLIICITDGTAANDAHWTVAQTNIDGAVVGPTSATDGHVVVFSGSSGRIVRSSGFTIAASVPSGAKFTDTVYTHPTFTAKSSGLYKITVNNQGHVTAATAVAKADITALGIPGSNTTYGIGDYNTSGLIKPWKSYTKASTGPTAETSDIAVAVNAISTTSGRYYAIEMDSSGRAFVNVPWENTDTDTIYTLPLAASGTRGGIKIGYTASGANVPVQLSSEKAYVALTKGAVTTALGYTPPTTNTTYDIGDYDTSGLIKPWKSYSKASTGPTAASDTTTAVAVNAITNTASRYYAIEMDSSGRAFVNVPWTNTTYSLSSFGITATAAELNYCDGVTSNIQTQLNGKAASSHSHSISNITNFPGTKSMNVNGTGYAIYTSASSLPTVYAPTAAGTSGQVLVSSGGAPGWKDFDEVGLKTGTVTKAITTDWANLISSDSMASTYCPEAGTYVIQVYSSTIGYNSGVFSWKSAGAGDEEILLHRSAASTNIYLKIKAGALQIAGAGAVSSGSISVKVKRLI